MSQMRKAKPPNAASFVPACGASILACRLDILVEVCLLVKNKMPRRISELLMSPGNSA